MPETLMPAAPAPTAAPTPDAAPVAAPALLLADSPADAAQLVSLLQAELSDAWVLTDPAAVPDPAQAPVPGLWLLACRRLADVRPVLARLGRGGEPATLAPGAARVAGPRVLLLCHKEALAEAFEACRLGQADDYAQVWPMPMDGYRPRLAVRQLLGQARWQLQVQTHCHDHWRAHWRGHWERQTQALAQQAPPLAALARQVDQAAAQGQALVEGSAQALAAHDPALAGLVQPVQDWARRLPEQFAPQVQAAQAVQALAQAAPSVLVVDDDPFQLRLLRTVLAGWPLRLRGAASGAEALAAAAEQAPDLVFMDIEMPGMDGIQTVRGLRAQPGMARVPVLMLTGQGDKARVVQSLQAGASGFIVKPFTRKVLHDLLARHLPQVPAPPG
ncbi:response regulator [Ideonella livida]|uniref:Response regulator n=1 Tax=Ideonella livida TaxID=2707176 RepID=A0A7C9PK48_9BURK|nr:response regulator [Ideonella livida]NDY93933.1 response regulator [Ideonella livida]